MKKQYGATMIETLVAALVLGIGLFGILSMQGRSLQYNQQASLHSQATTLALDIAERMRANASAIERYQVSNIKYIDSPGVECSKLNCTSEQLADWDLAHWKASVSGSLPLGGGSINQDNGDYVITVKYDAERDGATVGGIEAVTLVVRL